MLTVLQTLPEGSKITFQPNDSPEKVFIALKKAPHPIFAKNKDHAIPPQKTVLCKQHEAVRGEKSSQQYTYLGTTNLNQCIFVYIYNDTHYAAIHVDNNITPLNLEKHIQSFTSKENIKVVLIGGTPNHLEKSSTNVLHIIKAILSLSSSFPIQINAQYLIEVNAFKQSGMPAFIRDMIIERACALYQIRYHEPLEIEPLINIKLSSFSKKNEQNECLLLLLSGTMLHASTLMRAEQQRAVTVTEPIFATLIPNKEVFKNALGMMFTQEGFELMSTPFHQQKIYPSTELTHFAIDINTGEVNIISDFMPTPYHALRVLRLMELTTYSTDYFDTFIDGHYVVPTLSANLTQKLPQLIKDIAPILDKCVETDELRKHISSAFRSFDTNQFGHLKDLCRALQTLSRQPLPEPLPLSATPITFAYKLAFSNQEICQSLIELSAEDKAAVKRLC